MKKRPQLRKRTEGLDDDGSANNSNGDIQMANSVEQKPKPSISDDMEEDGISITPLPASSIRSVLPASSASIAKPKPKPSASLLSFEDEEGDALPSVLPKSKKDASSSSSVSFTKKSIDSASSKDKGRGLSATTKKALSSSASDSIPPPPVSFYHQTSSGEYTKEKLAALAKNSFVWKSNSSSEPPKQQPQAEEPEQVLPAPLPVTASSSSNAAASIYPSKPAARIPTSKEIEMAKRRREVLRAQKGMSGRDDEQFSESSSIERNDDFIPLGSSSSSNNKARADVKKKDEEEQVSGSDEDEDEEFEDERGPRIRFGDPGKAKSTAAAHIPSSLRIMDSSSKQKPEAIEVIDDEDQEEEEDAADAEEEEEMRAWEEAQIKKGGSTIPGSRKGTSSPVVALELHQKQREILGLKKSSISSPATSSPVLRPKKSPPIEEEAPLLSAEEVESSLERAIQETKKSVTTSKELVERKMKDLTIAEEDMIDMQEDMDACNSQYGFFQEMSDFMENFVDCMSEKVPLIEECEDEIRQLRSDYYQNLKSKRGRDVKEEYEDVLNDLGINGGSSAASSSMDPDLDEFGRDRNYFRRLSQQQRRVERKLKAENEATVRQVETGEIGSEGEEGADEEDDAMDRPSPVQQLRQRERAIISKAVNEIFVDVEDEFKSIPKIRQRFDVFRRKYPRAYKDSHCSSSAPMVFSPFVRMELLSWDPLTNPSLEEFKWHKMLADFGVSKHEDDKEDEEARTVVPRLVESIVMPLIRDALTSQYDPLSSRQTACAIMLMKDITAFVDPSSSNMFQATLAGLSSNLADAVESIALITSHRFPAAESSKDPNFSFARRQYWTACKLLKNLARWRQVLSEPLIANLCLDSLLNRKMLPYLRCVVSPLSVANLVDKLLQCIPVAWTDSSSAISPQLLRPLRDHLSLLNAAASRSSTPESQEISSALSRLIEKLSQ